MKVLQGTVTSDVNNKTIIVSVATSKNHPLYKKRYTTSKKYAAHDEANKAQVGDIVLIQECKPVSKNKTWVLKEVIGTETLRHEDAPTEEVA